MGNEEFNAFVEKLKQGNEAILDRLFLEHHAYCEENLSRKYATCTPADAKDLFMDALLKLREEMLKGKVENQNIRGYLLTIASRIWLKKIQRQPCFVPLEVEQAEYYLGKKEGMGFGTFDHLVASETEAAFKLQKQERFSLFQKGWDALSEQCRRLLKAFYLDGLRLKGLQKQLGYGSYDSIKSMRRKCFNKLVRQTSA